MAENDRALTFSGIIELVGRGEASNGRDWFENNPRDSDGELNESLTEKEIRKQ